jgi:flagellar biosynthesis protein FliR
MDINPILHFVPIYLLVLFRLAAMMVYAPLLGSSLIPKRVKALMAMVLAMSIARNLSVPPNLTDSLPALAIGIGGEIIFGLAIGLILSLTFIAAQWAGDLIGQQMGLNLSETFDPSFGSQGSIIGNLFFMLTLVIFLSINGHYAMLMGVRASFDSLPLLSVGMSKPLLDLFVGLFQSATQLALQLAAPVLVTLLVVDLAMGFIGKTMPQLNVMSAGLTVRSLVGMIVLIVGIGLTSQVIRQAVTQDMNVVWRTYTAPPPAG